MSDLGNAFGSDRQRLIGIIDQIADEAKRRVVDPRNVAKGCWLEMSDREIINKEQEERTEFVVALYTGANVIWEAGDKLVVDAMRVDKANAREVESG